MIVALLVTWSVSNVHNEISGNKKKFQKNRSSTQAQQINVQHCPPFDDAILLEHPNDDSICMVFTENQAIEFEVKGYKRKRHIAFSKDYPVSDYRVMDDITNAAEEGPGATEETGTRKSYEVKDFKKDKDSSIAHQLTWRKTIPMMPDTPSLLTISGASSTSTH